MTILLEKKLPNVSQKAPNKVQLLSTIKNFFDGNNLKVTNFVFNE